MDKQGFIFNSYLAPDGRRLSSEIRDAGNGSYSVEFMPEQVGDHIINIDHSGSPIHGSPFTVKTFNPDLIDVDIRSQRVRGEPCVLNSK